jgi:OOP family OmpA-OmpF porin
MEIYMKKKLLGLSLLSAVAFAQVASAQEYDNRWYVSGTAGVLFTDSDSDLYNDYLLGVGVGKRFSPNWAIDAEFTWSNPSYDNSNQADELFFNTKLDDLEITTLEFIARYYFNKEGRAYAPYLAGGLGYEENTLNYTDNNGNGQNVNDSGFVARLGVGIETNRMKRVDYRFEMGLRYADSGDYGTIATRTVTVPGSSVPVTESWDINPGSAMDLYATASVLVKLGDLPVPVVATVDCSTLDSDNDGVNDCDDKCPDSQPGQTIGADGCPVKLVIDLKGVNFDFDKATLRDDSVVILDEAVAVLNKYPQLRVAVDGHTDLCGPETHNQKLSENRAKTVFQYLVDKGIATDRLVGPTGYGEANPLVATGDKFPECKNETNRRTELNVQN